MKIITAMYTLRKGGSYERFVMLLEAFLERGCETHCLSLTPIPIKNRLFKNHIVCFPFKVRNDLIVKSLVLLLFPLYLLLIGWKEKIDLFVAFGPLYAFLQSVPKWILKTKMVTLFRLDLSLGSKKLDKFDWLNRFIEFVALLSSDRIITVNMGMKETIGKMFRKSKKFELEVLFNNIPNLTLEIHQDNIQNMMPWGNPGQAKIIATSGVLTPRKNLEVLLHCLAKIEIKNLVLLIIGEGSKKSDFVYVDNLKREARKMKIDDKVIFTGWIGKKELFKVYKFVDAFILTSLKEGMPNALLEALGCNVPCLGSNISGIQDILYYDELMFDPLDEHSITKKIYRLLTEEKYSDYVNQLCQERKKAFTFDWKERVFQVVTKTFPS